MADKAVAAWNYLGGFTSPYFGFGLPSSASAAVSSLANAAVNVYVNGGATAITTSSIAITETNMVTDLDEEGLSALDFEIEYKQRATGGGKKMIAPIEVSYNARRVTGS